MMTTRCLAAALLASLAMIRAADAQASPATAWLSEAQLLIDNDSWANTDRYYTNGLKFGGAVRLRDIWKPLRAPGEAALGVTRGKSGSEPFGGIFVGHNIYTPKNIRLTQPQPSDRPWAAWLYLGTVLQIVQPDGTVLDSVEFDLGVVGPAALGNEVQSNAHELVGVAGPRGWHNQIPNEPGFLLAYLHKRKLGNASADFIPHAGITLGTVLTLGRVGATVRLGKNLSGFGPDRIEPGGALLQNTRRYTEAERPRWEYYAFAGVDARYVVHNIFLDGTVFRDSPSVEKEHLVHDLSVGVSMRYRAFRFTFSRVNRSAEFVTELGSGAKQSFYSISLAYEPAPPAVRDAVGG